MLDGFDGIRSWNTCKNATGSRDIVNFNILPDGSLKKRAGYRRLADLGSKIRAIWTGRIDSIYRIFVLSGNTVSLIDPTSGAVKSIGEVETFAGKADFFYYRTGLYLIDGNNFYLVTSSAVTVATGYAPLVGKDWANGVVGEPFEARNLLSNKARISYVISNEASGYLRLGASAKSIDAVYLNGVLLSSDKYTVMSSMDLVVVSGAEAGDKIIICFTYSEPPAAQQTLLQNTNAFVFGGINTSRPFVWGSDNKALMFNCAYVTQTMLSESQSVYPQSDSLYFPEGYEFSVGDGRYKITAVSRHYDRLLIFTEGGMWTADSSACGIEEFPIMNTNASVGATSPNGAAMLGNEPCTIADKKIVRWRSSTDEIDECSAYSIADDITDLLPDEFFTTASVFADTGYNRLYFCAPCLDGYVWIWTEQTGKWVRFENIPAESFFDCNGNVGFVSDGSIYVFDETVTADEGDKEIVGRFVSNIMDFDTEKPKHISRIGATLEGGDVTADIYLDSQVSPALSVELKCDGAYTAISRRVAMRRTSYIYVAAHAGGEQRQIIHSLYIKTR